MPVFTQGAPSYDVLVVADEREVFGPYLPYRTWDPRPVAGTAGLRAMSWHPAHEQWGATQMQNRFQRFANRFMLPIDYQAWVAVRAIGEAASRVGSGDFAPINAYLRSDEFELAAFKGQKVTFRRWDGQLRQPIIIAGPELAGLDLAAGRLSARARRGRYAWHRRAGKRMQIPMTTSESGGRMSMRADALVMAIAAAIGLIVGAGPARAYRSMCPTRRGTRSPCWTARRWR